MLMHGELGSIVCKVRLGSTVSGCDNMLRCAHVAELSVSGLTSSRLGPGKIALLNAQSIMNQYVMLLFT